MPSHTQTWFEQLFNLAPDATIISDGRGRMVQVNEMACKLFGYLREEMIGQPIESIVPELDRSRHQAHRQMYYAHPRIRLMGLGIELFARRSNGTVFPVEIALAPLQTEAGMFVLAAVRDITERKELERVIRHREAQLAAAAEIQRFLLPQKSPLISGFEIAGHYYAAEFAAGDLFEFLDLPDKSLTILVADVSGHGVGPAILTASCHALFQSLAERNSDLTEIIRRVNTHLFRQSPEDLFLTLIAGRLDPENRTITCLNAGHPPGFVLDKSGQVTAQFNSSTIPLGISSEVEFRSGDTVSLEAKDLLLFFTDGLLEARSLVKDTMFGIDKALRVVREHQAESAREIIEALYHSVCEHQGTRVLQDDITIVVVKVAPD